MSTTSANSPAVPRTLACVGIDWGSTHRRVTVLDSAGEVLLRREDAEGALACRGRFAASLGALLQGLPPACAGLPVRMAGMVGSSVGWQEVPYQDAGLPLAALAHQLVPVSAAPAGCDWRIVPGLCFGRGTADVDVMRGEETQLLGALALSGAAADGCWVLPGTHSKWVELRGGRVVALRTYLSGELFALLGSQGTLANVLQAPADQGALAVQGFADGVAAARDPALSHQLFALRARVLSAALAPAAAAAWLSGLLIGSEWHDALRRGLPEGPVRLIASPGLATRHLECARLLGISCGVLDPQRVEVAAWRTLLAARLD